MNPDFPPPSETLTREAWEAFLQFFTHELRNKLNGIALEAADIAEQAPGVDASRLQKQMQECSAYLKSIRGSIAPEPPQLHATPVGEIMTEWQARYRRTSNIRVDWPDIPAEEITIDPTQVVTALTMLLEDLILFSSAGSTVSIQSDAARSGTVALILKAPVNAIPNDLDSWGRVLMSRKDDRALGRYAARRLLTQNGGGCAWTIDSKTKCLLLRVEFGVTAS